MRLRAVLVHAVLATSLLLCACGGDGSGGGDSSNPPPLTTKTLSVAILGSGAVSADGGGLSCPGVCSAAYDPGATVTLIATPGVGSTFIGWNGSCSGTNSSCTVQMTMGHSVMASFDSGSGSPARWQPVVTDTWQWQLTGTINTSYNVAVYDVDLFEAPVETIQSLQASGRKVLCYFSGGSAENWRSDYSRFLPADIGRQLDGWPGERWVDTRSDNVREIMRARLDLAVNKGCDGVEPDNVEAYHSNSGFPLTAATQLDFNRFLAQEAHNRNLAIALKNTGDLIEELGPDFDLAVNEECHQYNECDVYDEFIASGKPVFNAEYANVYLGSTSSARDALCVDALAQSMRTLVLPLDLDDGFRYSCD
jgi:hypothetical protein